MRPIENVQSTKLQPVKTAPVALNSGVTSQLANVVLHADLNDGTTGGNLHPSNVQSLMLSKSAKVEGSRFDDPQPH